MVIAVDFDGTIVEHKYPAIGKERTFAIETLRSLQKQGHLLILWTFRNGPELEEAVEYCKQRGLVFFAVNKSYPEEEYDNQISRKIHADVFIDDRNVGGFPGWGEIWHMLNKNASETEKEAFRALYRKHKRRSIGGFFQSLFCKDDFDAFKTPDWK